jgi:hypothetical protein
VREEGWAARGREMGDVRRGRGDDLRDRVGDGAERARGILRCLEGRDSARKRAEGTVLRAAPGLVFTRMLVGVQGDEETNLRNVEKDEERPQRGP